MAYRRHPSTRSGPPGAIPATRDTRDGRTGGRAMPSPGATEARLRACAPSVEKDRYVLGADQPVVTYVDAGIGASP